jgi:hypothetical protein
MMGIPGWLNGRGLVAATVMVVALAPVSALAQFGGSLFGGQQQLAPPTPPASIPNVPASPPVRLAPPPAPEPPLQRAPAPPQGGSQAAAPTAGQTALTLSARFGREASQQIGNGLVWRVYPARADSLRAPRPVKEEKTASPVFMLPPGDYVVHVSFGLASAMKTVSLRSESMREVFDLPAGGIRLEGKVADARIPNNQILFDIYRGSQFDTGERPPVASKVAPGDIVVLPEGTYYIVSNYGDSNAVVRSDIRVQTAKLTDVVISHRAAAITLKLVANRGGEALANTEWTVLTPGGDVIKEATGAFPRVVLAEGEYRAIARSEGKTFEHAFKVTTGVDSEIEVLTR